MEEKNKKKILFLITKSNWGGAQRYVYDIATNLDTSVFDVVVALGGDGTLKTKLEEASVRTITIPSLQRDISITKELKAIWSLGTIIRNEDPDVIHLNSSKAGLLGAFLGRLLGVPNVLFTAHGWAFNENRGCVAKLFLRYLHWLTVFLTHHTIAVSHITKSQLPGHFVQKKMTVIHNGITPPNFLSHEDARTYLYEKVPTLEEYSTDTWTVTIGELHPIKNHHIAIEAIATLAEKPIRHIVIGSGEEEARLKKLVADKELEKRVFFTGPIPDAATLLKAFDVFILPSQSEALPYVLLEACSADIQIIATNVGGIPEILPNTPKNSLIEPNDSTALAEAIVTHLKQTEVAPENKSTKNTLTTMITETKKLYLV